MNDMKITKDILLNNGFKEVYEEELWKNALKDFYGIDDFFVAELWTEDESPIKIDMRYKITNNEAEWYMHLDNEDCETIGSADIDYIWQFNKMMEIFNSKFRLK
jgi:hypothetical protein